MPLLDSIHVFEDGIAGGAFETLAAADGDSLSIRDYGEGGKVTLISAWGANNATKCDFSIRSPLLHDNTRGLAFAPLLAYVAGGQSRLSSMPANTDAERKARMNFWFDYMRGYQAPG